MENPILPPLQQYLSARYPGARLTAFQFLTSGFESDVYVFTLDLPGRAAQPLILRLYPGAGAAEKMARETAGLLHLRQAGYPVPSMLLSEADAAVLGKPFCVMEKLEGSSLWPVLAAAAPDEAAGLLDRFGALLSRLHRLDWRPFTDSPARYEADPALLLRESLAASRRLYEQYGVPELLPVQDWLEARQAQIQVQPAVAHLDFHANNVFLCSDGRMAVIDWTQVTVADYRADLSWSLLIMGDFGQPAWGERILAAYQRAKGGSIMDLPYFQVISYTKLLSSTLISLKTSPAGLGMRPETAQSIQQQAPVLRLLAQRVAEITGLSFLQDLIPQ